MTRLELACAMLYLSSAVGVVYGLIDLLTPRILPHHERFLGLRHEELPPRVARLLLSALRIIGVLLICLSASLAAIVYFAFSAREVWSWWLLLLAWLAALIPLVLIGLRIDRRAPWKTAAALIVLILLALLLVGPKFHGWSGVGP